MPRKQDSAAARAVATLRERIIDGTYSPGGRLPSATAIATEFDIDRGTASRVLAELRHAGLIITKPGSGSFVRTFEPILRRSPEGSSLRARAKQSRTLTPGNAREQSP